MSDVIGLVLPFFGLIFLGFVVARITRQPIEALGWMTTFIIYVALPALFFQLLAKTPDRAADRMGLHLRRGAFDLHDVPDDVRSARCCFARRNIAESTIKGLAAAYGNIGYMGPGLALLAFGPEAAVPVALIFCFENIMHFTVAPMMMALSGGEQEHAAAACVRTSSARSCCIRSSSPPPPAWPPPISSCGRRCRSSACSNICRALPHLARSSPWA